MNNIQRNDTCHCGSGLKYKHCCLNKDAATTQLSKVQHDIRKLITPHTLPYIFWKRWSAACLRSEYGLLFNMLLDNTPLKNQFASEADFFANLQSLGLPFEPNWNLDKMKLTESMAYLLTHKIESTIDKSITVTLMSLQRTELGWRVQNVQKSIIHNIDELAFDLFDIKSIEYQYRQKIMSGWTQPDLADKFNQEQLLSNAEDQNLNDNQE